MPFTPAHPAIVLPFLKRTRLSALGLIVGSMSPDFEYFLKMKVNSLYSHTLPGLFYFDLPVTIVLSWLFIRFVRNNLFFNLPPFFQSRLRQITQLEVRRVLVDGRFAFIVGALLGSLSHIFWDGFTHNNTFFVRNFSFYDGVYIPFRGVNYPLWYALQHISTGLGLMIMLIYVIALPAQPGAVHKPNALYWLVVLAITSIVVVLRFVLWPDDLTEGNLVVSAITGFCISVIGAGMINFNNAVTEAK